MTRDDFTCELVRGLEVSFPFDRERLAAFRALSPDIRWRKDSRAWLIPGFGAASQTNLWIDERKRQEQAADEGAVRAGKIAGLSLPASPEFPKDGRCGRRTIQC